MKILIYSRAELEHHSNELNVLMDEIARAGFDYKINNSFASVVESLTGRQIKDEHRFDIEKGCPQADIAVSYGGDGTFLECVKLIGLCSVPILGINSGRLGFLANVPKNEIRQAFDDLRNGKYKVAESTLLEVEGDAFQDTEHRYAFNEFAIQRGGTGMIAVETYVNDEMVATYRGDGILLSTAAGSTAYSLSVGGPVVAPECGCLVLSPIAPHNLNMRPVVIPDTSQVKFKVASRGQKIIAALDSYSSEASDGAEFIVRKAKKTIFLVRLQNISFYDTLRNKMLWGFDRRDEISV